MTRRLAAIGGIAGPVAFVTAWAVLGADARRRGYAPTRDPISRLAALGAPTRAEMTTGFLAFAVGVSLFAASLREHLSSRAAAWAVANAVATLGVAALPLEGFGGDKGHALAAGAAYAALAALPLAGAPALEQRGFVAAARASRLLAVAVALSLVLSIAGTSRTGLFQRLGLTLGDVWIVATAWWILRGAKNASD